MTDNIDAKDVLTDANVVLTDAKVVDAKVVDEKVVDVEKVVVEKVDTKIACPKTTLTPYQYKMHGYAIFIILELQEQGIIDDDIDPFSLDIQRLLDYDPTTIVPQLKKFQRNKNKKPHKKKTITITSSSKPNIIAEIVAAHNK